MVFSSISAAFLDPSNWQQQQQQQQQQHPSRQPAGSSGLNPHPHPHQLQPPPPSSMPQQQQPSHGPIGGGTMIRPRSMAERALLANIPTPEAALKCPRCESTNTKFCYYNNYNLSQPRHFCKTCRRYWTRDGKLRNIPVGGGCRRNKRTKSSGSNKKDKRSTTSASSGSVSDNSGSSNVLASSAGCATSSTTGLLGLMSQIQSLGFIAPMHDHHNHHLGDYFSSSKIGLTYGGISAQPPEGISGDPNFQFSGGIDGGNSGVTGGIEQWHVQQFPYISNQDLQAGINPTYERGAEPSIFTTKPITSGLTSQPTSVKIENSNYNNNNNNNNSNQTDPNLSRRMAWIQGNGQFWGTSGSMWTDHSGFGNGNNNDM